MEQDYGSAVVFEEYPQLTNYFPHPEFLSPEFSSSLTPFQSGTIQ